MIRSRNFASDSRLSILALLAVILLLNQLINQTDGKFIRERQSSSSSSSTSTSRIIQEEEAGDIAPEDGENDLDKDLEELDAMKDLVEELVGEDIGYYGDSPPEEVKEGNFKNGVGPKPIMHTFYQRIDPEHHHTGTTFNQGTGMSSDEAHLALVQAWQESWEAAGFETRILNIDDVMKHDRYDEIRAFLDNEAFGEYDELCFLRWYAMSAVGGGWMSDYDVVPLKSLVPNDYFTAPEELSEGDMDGNNGIPLPNNGYFTVYSWQVPSLMSGSANEWERLAQALMDLTHQHLDDFYSDMYALMDYDKTIPDAYIKEDQVLSRLSDFILENGDIDCEKVWKMNDEHLWAVHFSHWNVHDAVEHGILDSSTTPDDRPNVAREFILNWEEECSNNFSDEE